jgi:hypothetical protein
MRDGCMFGKDVVISGSVKAGITFSVCVFIDVHNRDNRNRGEERNSSDE